VKATLYTLGALFELAGIVAVASPDLVPGAVRFAAWLRVRLRRAVDRLRRFIGRPRPQVIEVGLAGAVATAGSLSFSKSVNANANLEQQVAFLLHRDQEAQRDVNALAKRVTEVEQGAPRRLAELRAEMEAHVEHKLTAAQADFRAARVLGAFALAIGLALTTIANFVK
jgi:hypothetical protein